MKIEITELTNHGDTRGFSFSPPAAAMVFLGNVADMHLASTAPGAVRGNHYHVRKNEAILLLPGTQCSFHWDDGEGTPVQHRSFAGDTAVVILVSPGASHAVRNDGDQPLWLVTCSSEAYDPQTVVTRKVL
jgi:oxalate decarboxylase/phosphoglucose isomerase-like protein (cupin superfamily)